jgi:hypothetical protein
MRLIQYLYIITIFSIDSSDNVLLLDMRTQASIEQRDNSTSKGCFN